jgi:hypothetical protein
MIEHRHRYRYAYAQQDSFSGLTMLIHCMIQSATGQEAAVSEHAWWLLQPQQRTSVYISRDLPPLVTQVSPSMLQRGHAGYRRILHERH